MCVLVKSERDAVTNLDQESVPNEQTLPRMPGNLQLHIIAVRYDTRYTVLPHYKCHNYAAVRRSACSNAIRNAIVCTRSGRQLYRTCTPLILRVHRSNSKYNCSSCEMLGSRHQNSVLIVVIKCSALGTKGGAHQCNPVPMCATKLLCWCKAKVVVLDLMLYCCIPGTWYV